MDEGLTLLYEKVAKLESKVDLLGKEVVANRPRFTTSHVVLDVITKALAASGLPEMKLAVPYDTGGDRFIISIESEGVK